MRLPVRLLCSAALIQVIVSGCASRSHPDASLSPDGSRVAVARGSEGPLLLLDADGRESTALRGTEGASEAAWSRDGSVLLFLQSSDPGGNDPAQRVAAYDLATQRVTPIAPDVTGPLCWSPDGRRFLAFGSIQQPDGAEGGPTQEARFYRYPEGDVEARIPLTVSVVPDAVPVWIPDAERVAILANGDNGPDVWLLTPDGATPLTHTHDVVGFGMAPDASALAWACAPTQAVPQGARFFAMRRRDGAVLSLGVPHLAPDPGRGGMPDVRHVSFSPDGSGIAETVLTPAGPAVYVGQFRSPTFRRVVSPHRLHRDADGAACAPADLAVSWAGNGSRFVVSSSDDSRPVTIFRADGRGRRVLSLPGDPDPGDG